MALMWKCSAPGSCMARRRHTKQVLCARGHRYCTGIVLVRRPCGEESDGVRGKRKMETKLASAITKTREKHINKRSSKDFKRPNLLNSKILIFLFKIISLSSCMTFYQAISYILATKKGNLKAFCCF